MCESFDTVLLVSLQDKMRETLKQKDAYISKLESNKQSQDRELAYLLATNSDLSDENQVSLISLLIG